MNDRWAEGRKLDLGESPETLRLVVTGADPALILLEFLKEEKDRASLDHREHLESLVTAIENAGTLDNDECSFPINGYQLNSTAEVLHWRIYSWRMFKFVSGTSAEAELAPLYQSILDLNQAFIKSGGQENLNYE